MNWIISWTREPDGLSLDTDAISEMLRKRPLLDYLQWLRSLDRENQYTSSITIAELYKGAFRSPKRNHFLEKIETRIIPEFTILPFDRLTAKIYGEIQAQSGSLVQDIMQFFG